LNTRTELTLALFSGAGNPMLKMAIIEFESNFDIEKLKMIKADAKYARRG
jgi:hypothetical protein